MQLNLHIKMGVLMYLDNVMELLLFCAAFTCVLLVGGAIINVWNYIFNFLEGRK